MQVQGCFFCLFYGLVSTECCEEMMEGAGAAQKHTLTHVSPKIEWYRYPPLSHE